MVLPLLALFLCAALDFGHVVLCQIALSDAAHAAASWGCEKISQGTNLPLSADAARKAALEAAPSLEGDGFNLQIDTSARSSKVGFSRKTFSEEDGGFVTQNVQLESRDVTVHATFSGTYLTVVGKAVAMASGSSNGLFVLEANSCRSAYEPEGNDYA